MSNPLTRIRTPLGATSRLTCWMLAACICPTVSAPMLMPDPPINSPRPTPPTLPSPLASKSMTRNGRSIASSSSPAMAAVAPPLGRDKQPAASNDNMARTQRITNLRCMDFILPAADVAAAMTFGMATNAGNLTGFECEWQQQARAFAFPARRALTLPKPRGAIGLPEGGTGP